MQFIQGVMEANISSLPADCALKVAQKRRLKIAITQTSVKSANIDYRYRAKDARGASTLWENIPPVAHDTNNRCYRSTFRLLPSPRRRPAGGEGEAWEMDSV